MRYDAACARTWFGHDVSGITLGHTLPFFADIADDFFAALIVGGVEFIGLEEALADPAYGAVASVPSAEFLVFQQKLAAAANEPMAMIAPGFEAMFADITSRGQGWEV